MVNGLPADGRLLYWQGSATVRAVAAQAQVSTASYGISEGDWRAESISYTSEGLRFTLWQGASELGALSVPLYGAHNVLNTVVAAAACLGEGVSMVELQTALKRFKGAARRFEKVSDAGASVNLFDDYAHHPTEVATTLDAAQRHFGGRVIAIFQPHTYSRTKELLKEYQQSFGSADVAFISVIEAAREQTHDAEKSVSGAAIADKAGDNVRYIADRAQLLAAVVAECAPGDTVVSMSVGGNNHFAEELAARLG
jgi:UDP-N-acetylmuramate--alanine ligase